MQWIRFVFEGNAPTIYLNASMFMRIIHDPASPSEEESIRFFNESLQIAFLNNMLVRIHPDCLKDGLQLVGKGI